uniref:Syntaxin N-terminal domain-containing protein n=1 Tax=Parascaris univalens TaxID=6257 RepID=A0A914ZCV1_PARUN
MVKDRSSEFRRKAGQYASGEGLDVLENGSVTEPNSSFFFEVEDSRKLIENLVQDIIKLRSKQNMILADPIVEVADKEQLDEFITAIRHRTGILKPRLLKMKNDIEDATKSGIRGADLRIRKYHVEALIKKLADALEMFSNAELDYRRRVASRIKRQLDLAGEHLSESEVDAMIDSKSTQIFHKRASTALMRSALEDATSRHNEILKLESSINELNEMYSDLAILVHSQGEMVDRIDTNVDDTTYIIEEGNKLTRMAAQYHKGSISKKIYCGVLSILI